MENLDPRQVATEAAIVAASASEIIDYAVRIEEKVQAIQETADALQHDRAQLRAILDRIQLELRAQEQDGEATAYSHPLVPVLRRVLALENGQSTTPPDELDPEEPQLQPSTTTMSHEERQYQSFILVLGVSAYRLNQRVKILEREKALREAAIQHEGVDLSVFSSSPIHSTPFAAFPTVEEQMRYATSFTPHRENHTPRRGSGAQEI